MTSREQRAADRAANLAKVRAAQARTQRRQKAVIIGGALAAGLGLGVAAALAVARDIESQAASEALTEGSIDGVVQFEGLSQEHVPGPVEYEQSPPAGGQHAGVWVNCGVYTAPIPNEQAVHSLEHGAVWLTYSPELAPEGRETLTSAAEKASYALLSPVADLPVPVVASAWGVQLTLDDPSDPRLEQFLQKYLQGEQTPEPGAPCTGGVDPT
ncbi:DUF3105 domain-containing protein [Cellulomonas fimi]|uniref:DUF3105 domain-containing protein n=1 Tax=Cellulomonas fimi TaxID=1708 RepID=A0A7Y0LX32_CELFI|nr:DUF3105 domain-containing protein [Cellulomonas fimi]NMR19476.1 DUF3105 domain-containing protein [Cellulomonas fimi]